MREGGRRGRCQTQQQPGCRSARRAGRCDELDGHCCWVWCRIARKSIKVVPGPGLPCPSTTVCTRARATPALVLPCPAGFSAGFPEEVPRTHEAQLAITPAARRRLRLSACQLLGSWTPNRAEGVEGEGSSHSGTRAREKKEGESGPGKPELGHSCLRTGWVRDLVGSQEGAESRKRAKVTIMAILVIPALPRVIPQPGPRAALKTRKRAQGSPESDKKRHSGTFRDSVTFRNSVTFARFWQESVGLPCPESGFSEGRNRAIMSESSLSSLSAIPSLCSIPSDSAIPSLLGPLSAPLRPVRPMLQEGHFLARITKNRHFRHFVTF